MATQTSIIREALEANPRMSIEDIIRYGLAKHGVVVREHSIYNCLKRAAREEEVEALRKKVESLERQLKKGKK